MAFTANQLCEGIWHITDAMGVCMTLLCGTERALLVDTGYGLQDVQAFVRTLTDRPLTVILTHGHHDHAMGVRWFEQTCMFAEDQHVFEERICTEQRRKILDGAAQRGLAVDEAAYLSAVLPLPLPLQAGPVDLGGLTAEIIRCPGHTLGSCVVYVPEHAVLLTGDDWNPCTWLFFPSALGVHEYRANVQKLLALPFTHVLCSHRAELWPRGMFEDFLNGLTDDTLRAAVPVKPGPYPEKDTREARLPHDQILVFDWNKSGLA